MVSNKKKSVKGYVLGHGMRSIRRQVERDGIVTGWASIAGKSVKVSRLKGSRQWHIDA